VHVTHNATVVPHEAIQPGPHGPTVVVLDSKLAAHRRPVRTGDEDETGIAVMEGVRPGERVVVLSAQPVRDGQVVRIDKSSPPVQTVGVPSVIGGGGGITSGIAVRVGGSADAATDRSARRAG